MQFRQFTFRVTHKIKKYIWNKQPLYKCDKIYKICTAAAAVGSLLILNVY